MVMIILIPLVMGLIQFGLFLHVRNTLVACAHEGARVAAAANQSNPTGNGRARAQECISTALHPRFGSNIAVNRGAQITEVRVDTGMPAIGFMGSDVIPLQIAGRAVVEPNTQ